MAIIVAACSSSDIEQVRSSPWAFDDSGQEATGDVVGIAAGTHGTATWSSALGDGGNTWVDADVMRKDGSLPRSTSNSAGA